MNNFMTDAHEEIWKDIARAEMEDNPRELETAKRWLATKLRWAGDDIPAGRCEINPANCRWLVRNALVRDHSGLGREIAELAKTTIKLEG